MREITVPARTVCQVCDRLDVVSFSRDGRRLVPRCSCGALAPADVYEKRHAA